MKKSYTQFIGVTTISCLLLLTFNTNAKERLVSQKVINSTGLKIIVKGKPYIVTNIVNKKEPNKDCKLDVSSLHFLSLKDMPQKKGVTATITLQAKVGKKGHPYCSGKGEGCVMTIEVPDAKEPQQKLRD